MVKAKSISTVDELIEALLPYKGKKVESTWEGIKQSISVYLGVDDVLLLDCDDCFYQVRWQELKCSYCGNLGNYFEEDNKTIYCYNCGYGNKKS